MKKSILGLLLLCITVFSFSSCSKTAEEPDLALIVQGSYNVTFLKVGATSLTLPNATSSAIMNFLRKDSKTVAWSFTVIEKGISTVSPSNDLTLKDAGNGQVSIYNANGVSLGTGTAKNISLSVTDNNGQLIVFTASR